MFKNVCHRALISNTVFNTLWVETTWKLNNDTSDLFEVRAKKQEPIENQTKPTN